MITLQELFDDFAYGELSDVAMGNSHVESLDESKYPAAVSALNMGLEKIYRRLNLRQGKIKLHQQAGVTTYYLRAEHAAEEELLDEDLYIELGDCEEFPSDLIKVLTAVDSEDDEVRINDSTYPDDLFTPSYDVITVNERSPLEIFTITYQARYPKIAFDQTFDPTKVELEIPDFIEEPLLVYMAHRMFKKPIKVVKGEINPATNLMYEFNAMMLELERLSVDIDVNDTAKTFEDNGWV